MRIRCFRGGAAFAAALLIFAAVLALFLGVFARSARPEVRVDPAFEVWLLLRDCDGSTSAAVVGDSYLAGGAGYLLEEESAVVLACYYRESDASFVRGTLAQKGVSARVERRTSEVLTLRGSDAGERARLLAGVNVVGTCARILFDTANGLERSSLTQEEARTAVRGVASSLAGLVRDADGAFYERWNAGLYPAERRAREIAEGILFAKDLRYLQVALCMRVLGFPRYFS